MGQIQMQSKQVKHPYAFLPTIALCHLVGDTYIKQMGDTYIKQINL